VPWFSERFFLAGMGRKANIFVEELSGNFGGNRVTIPPTPKYAHHKDSSPMMFSEAISPSAIPGTIDDRSMAAAPSCSTLLSKRRLGSIDALRGFTMFWLIGGRELFLGIAAALLGPACFDFVDTQLTHPKWQGFVAWDMVMPIFLFVVGLSMPFAMGRRQDCGVSQKAVYGRIFRRVAALWILGMINQATKEAEGPELYSNTLQAIAVGYLVTSIALLHLQNRGRIALFAALVLIYGGLLMFMPFPDHPGGTLQRTANLPRYLDEIMLAGFRRDHSFTWLLTSLGFAASVLMGAMGGLVLKSQSSVARKVLQMVSAGVVCMALGWIWSYWLPFNRHLWTSSMILWAGGIGFLLSTLFYLVIDVLQYQRWSFPFVVIGANALLAYILDPIFDQTAKGIFLNLYPECEQPLLGFVIGVFELTILWTLLLFLYRRRLFLRA
jgi:predicted acyltransferase